MKFWKRYSLVFLLLGVANLGAPSTSVVSAQQSLPPITTCSLTPANIDQFCVMMANTFGYSQAVAVMMTQSHQGISVISNAESTILSSMRNQEAVDIKALNAKIDDSRWIGVDSASICKWTQSSAGFDPGLPGVTDKALGHVSAGDCLQFLSVPEGTHALAVAVSSPYGAGAFHFESPLGTRISATTTVINTTNWWLYLTQIVPLTAAPAGNSVWWICDTPRLNIAGIKPAR